VRPVVASIVRSLGARIVRSLITSMVRSLITSILRPVIVSMVRAVGGSNVRPVGGSNVRPVGASNVRPVIVAAVVRFMKSQLSASIEGSAAAITFPGGWEVVSCQAMLVPGIQSSRKLPLAGPAGIHDRVR